MKVEISCKFMSFSNRIQGTTDDGKEYDYYRLKAFFEGDNTELSFSVRNLPSYAASIARCASYKFGDSCKIVVDFAKSRDRNYWFCNFVEVK